MKNYVVGFMFNPELTHVVLIRKEWPDWQKGKLNGVGGKIEEGELPYNAMVREFYEETGLLHATWTPFMTMTGIGNDPWSVEFFTTTSPNYRQVETKTEEKVTIHLVGMLRHEVMLENVHWGILLAKDVLEDGKPSHVTVVYENRRDGES